MSEMPTILKGKIFSDYRGSISFVNEFHFDNIKRFYIINHSDTKIVRAWQGHQFEKKYFYPISGSFVLAWVKIDNFEKPSMNLISQHQILSANKPLIISIPKGYANGFKALQANSEIMVLSDTKLEESVNEESRYPSEWWFNWNMKF